MFLENCKQSQYTTPIIIIVIIIIIIYNTFRLPETSPTQLRFNQPNHTIKTAPNRFNHQPHLDAVW